MYSYFIVDRYIIRIYSWQVKRHPGRFATYLQTNEALFNRAKKYGYKTVTLD